jgi:hypothetical protein
VFGAGSLNTRIRMVYASWGLPNNVQTYFNDTLAWLDAEYVNLPLLVSVRACYQCADVLQ